MARPSLFFCFWRSFLAFAIKVPMFPFHTWLPDAHVESSHCRFGDSGRRSAEDGHVWFRPFRLAVLSRTWSCTPKVRGWMIFLSIVGIIYGALVSLVQKDMKKLVAYSSVSHLGFCTLGIFALNPAGLSGSVSATDQPWHFHRSAVPDCRHSL